MRQATGKAVHVPRHIEEAVKAQLCSPTFVRAVAEGVAAGHRIDHAISDLALTKIAPDQGRVIWNLPVWQRDGKPPFDWELDEYIVWNKGLPVGIVQTQSGVSLVEARTRWPDATHVTSGWMP